MLRIIQHRNPDSTVLFKLEGKLLAPWIGELHHAIDRASAKPPALQLDLSALAFADASGMRTVADLICQGATLVACSGYIAALLTSPSSSEQSRGENVDE